MDLLFSIHAREISRLCTVAYEAGERAMSEVTRLAVTREAEMAMRDPINTAMQAALRARDIADRFSQKDD